MDGPLPAELLKPSSLYHAPGGVGAQRATHDAQGLDGPGAGRIIRYADAGRINRRSAHCNKCADARGGIASRLRPLHNR